MNVAAEHRSAEKAARALLNVNDEGTDWKSRAIIGLILMNGVAVLLESNDAWHTLYATEFRLFEYFSILVFTVEYVLRLWLAPKQERYRHLGPADARVRYALTPTALVDLLAVAPFYLSLFIVIDLRYLRLFRLLRLMKLSHYFDGLQVFFLVLRREAAALNGALFTMTILVLVSACAMFSAEHAAQPEAFGTVIDAIWWSTSPRPT
ncbi:MAG: ion transporter, partial [Myxococcota bacterium]